MKPWYLDPFKTCAVLNRIARHFTAWAGTAELRVAMDKYTAMLWKKADAYYELHRV